MDSKDRNENTKKGVLGSPQKADPTLALGPDSLSKDELDARQDSISITRRGAELVKDVSNEDTQDLEDKPTQPPTECSD